MTQAATPQRESQLPIREFRSGLVKATIWENQIDRDGQTVVVHNVKITRSYKDKKDNWQENNSFDMYSLADVIDVATEARKSIRLRLRDPRAQTATEAPVPAEDTPE